MLRLREEGRLAARTVGWAPTWQEASTGAGGGAAVAWPTHPPVVLLGPCFSPVPSWGPVWIPLPLQVGEGAGTGSGTHQRAGGVGKWQMAHGTEADGTSTLCSFGHPHPSYPIAGWMTSTQVRAT